MELSVALGVALIVGAVRAWRRLRGSWSGPIPDVPNAPRDASPIGGARYNDDGLATFSVVMPRSPARPRDDDAS
jgi:hypothetical protein